MEIRRQIAFFSSKNGRKLLQENGKFWRKFCHAQKFWPRRTTDFDLLGQADRRTDVLIERVIGEHCGLDRLYVDSTRLAVQPGTGTCKYR